MLHVIFTSKIYIFANKYIFLRLIRFLEGAYHN
jgi:hypothetical protein